MVFVPLGSTDCTLPWLRNSDALVAEMESLTTNRCPTPIVGDGTKTYCCYNFKGQVNCCDSTQFFVFGFVSSEFVFYK